MVRAVGLLFEIKAVDRVGANAVRQARQEARHHQTQIAGIFGFTQRTPGGVFGVLEDLGQVARVSQLLRDSICITPGAVPVINGQCAAEPMRAISPSSSTSCGLWSK